MLFKKSLTAAAMLLFLNTTWAAPILTSFTDESVFFGEDQSLGYAFSSDTSTTITALGFWDSNRDGFNEDHEVALWDSAGTLLGSVDLTAGTGDTLIGDFRYANLTTAVSLIAGATYFLAGTTTEDFWVFQASNIVMQSGFNYLGSYFFDGTPGGQAVFPGSLAFSREYMTVNALSGEAAIPLPGTLALLSIGLIAVSRRLVKDKHA
ncbi:MAG: DUF4082 domain-containing protein [Pseudomonadota bacterium]